MYVPMRSLDVLNSTDIRSLQIGQQDLCVDHAAKTIATKRIFFKSKCCLFQSITSSPSGQHIAQYLKFVLITRKVSFIYLSIYLYIYIYIYIYIYAHKVVVSVAHMFSCSTFSVQVRPTNPYTSPGERLSTYIWPIQLTVFTTGQRNAKMVLWPDKPVDLQS